MKKISLPLKMLLLMIVSGILFIIFRLLYENYGTIWYDFVSDISLIIFLQMLITHLCAPVVFIVFRKKFNYKNPWFKEKDFENRLYKLLKVKKWKSKVTTYEENQVSITHHSIEDVILNMCHAEIVHEFIAICSYLPLALCSHINSFLLITSSLCFSIIHLLYAVIQRYNRPRLIKILERKSKEREYNL